MYLGRVDENIVFHVSFLCNCSFIISYSIASELVIGRCGNEPLLIKRRGEEGVGEGVDEVAVLRFQSDFFSVAGGAVLPNITFLSLCFPFLCLSKLWLRVPAGAWGAEHVWRWLHSERNDIC